MSDRNDRERRELAEKVLLQLCANWRGDESTAEMLTSRAWAFADAFLKAAKPKPPENRPRRAR